MKIVAKSDDIGIILGCLYLVFPPIGVKALKDKLRSNADYPALDVLKGGFAIFHLKVTSEFACSPRAAYEAVYLKSIFKSVKFQCECLSAKGALKLNNPLLKK